MELTYFVYFFHEVCQSHVGHRSAGQLLSAVLKDNFKQNNQQQKAQKCKNVALTRAQKRILTIWVLEQEGRVSPCLTAGGNMPVRWLEFPTLRISSDDCESAEHPDLGFQMNLASNPVHKYGMWEKIRIDYILLMIMGIKLIRQQCSSISEGSKFIIHNNQLNSDTLSRWTKLLVREATTAGGKIYQELIPKAWLLRLFVCSLTWTVTANTCYFSLYSSAFLYSQRRGTINGQN